MESVVPTAIAPGVRDGGPVLDLLATLFLLRGPASWGGSGEGPTFDLEQVVMLAGVFALLALLAGVVIWRVRRTSRKE